MKLVYFAHPVTHYGKDIEIECEKTIREEMKLHLESEIEIFNPNQVWLDRLYKNRKLTRHPNPFEIFTEIVGVCDVVVGVTFTDGKIGAGVYKEMVSSDSNYGYPTYVLPADSKFVFEFNEKQISHLALTIEETRERIKKGII
jgi:hypothetical protein